MSIVIAFDYYDGEVEGIARRECNCSYFKRVRVGEDDMNEYVSVKLDSSVFDEVLRLAGATASKGTVFVYSGDSEAANRKIDELAKACRPLLDSSEHRTLGATYLDSLSDSGAEF